MWFKISYIFLCIFHVVNWTNLYSKYIVGGKSFWSSCQFYAHILILFFRFSHPRALLNAIIKLCRFPLTSYILLKWEFKKKRYGRIKYFSLNIFHDRMKYKDIINILQIRPFTKYISNFILFKVLPIINHCQNGKSKKRMNKEEKTHLINV